MKKYNYLYVVESCLPYSVVFRCLLNVSFSSTVLMPPRTLFQLMGPWYTNARSPYDLVLAVPMVNMLGLMMTSVVVLVYTLSKALTDILDMR